MLYGDTMRAVFEKRLNRFVARVVLEGEPVEVHVKNTGRLGELLVPGATVVLERAEGQASRKTAYDLIGAYREGKLYNIDSQAPNRVVREWLVGRGYSVVRSEFPYKDSRLDFYLERGGVKTLLEVKDCTLEEGGKGYFPDAVTERGARHLGTLRLGLLEGYHSVVGFVIQMEGVSQVLPHAARDPAFAEAFQEAREAGVEVAFFLTRVREGELSIRECLGGSL